MGEKNRDIAQRDSVWRFEGGDGEERQELNGLDIHGPGEADGEVLLSYIVMFHKTRFLDLCRMMKK